VSEYLWWRGLTRIDYLVATHADADHIDGLNDIARNFKVRAALAARSPTLDPEFAKLSQTLESSRVPVRLVGGGDTLRLGDVVIDVLWPMPSADPNAASGNNESMILSVRFGSRSVLLLGDIETNAERALVEEQGRRLLNDVTKVAHHGSRTSSNEAFVRATRSKLAVISVGQSSVFGHPHPEVVHRWESSGAQVVTTGNRGMITLITDGRDMHFNTFVNP
jgi:competence protein ComEC